MPTIQELSEEIKHLKLQLKNKQTKLTDLDKELKLANVTIRERLDRLENLQKQITALLQRLLKYEKMLFVKEEEMRKPREAEWQGKLHSDSDYYLIFALSTRSIFISISDVSWPALHTLFRSSLMSSSSPNRSTAPTSTRSIPCTTSSSVSLPPSSGEFSNGEENNQSPDPSEPLLSEAPQAMSIRRRVAALSTTH